MKHLENARLEAWDGQGLVLSTQQAEATITRESLMVRTLFRYAAMKFPATNLGQTEAPLAALRSLTEEEERDDTHVHLEDDWYKALRNYIDSAVALEWGINGGVIAKRLDELVAQGELLNEATRIAEGAGE